MITGWVFSTVIGIAFGCYVAAAEGPLWLACLLSVVVGVPVALACSAVGLP